MSGRGIFGFFMTLVFVGVLFAIGAGIYQAGVAQGVIDAGRFPAGAAVPVGGYVGYHGGFGFGFLGLLFPLLFLFLIFGLIRAAFSRGRGWGNHGYGRGYGYGPRSGGGPERREGRNGGPEGWREERDRQMAELHRRLHEQDGGSGGTPGTAGGPADPAK
jgi:hypothetical protein